MSNQSKITSTIEQIPFADLYVSEFNPRSVVDDASITVLAENIRQVGLIQNLAGLRDVKGNKIGIVAGGRRLRALALLQDDARFKTVPVQIAPDEATARDWAAAENHNREAPHPADEIAEFGAMYSERGIKVPAIAIAFGVTEAHVYRRLALADLPAPVLAALKDGSLTLAMATAFTVSNDEKLSLEVLERVRGDSYSEAQIKRMLKPTSLRSTDRRALFVGEDAYKAAGGLLTSDLFSEESLFDSPEILDGCFAIALEKGAEQAQAEQGWKWVDYTSEPYLGYFYFEENKLERVYPVEGALSDEQSERYDELAELANGDALDEEGKADLAALQSILDGDYTAEQKQYAGAVVYADNEGLLVAVGGLIHKEDVSAAREAGILPKRMSYVQDDDTPKSPYSAKLTDDLACVAQGAQQHAILRDPDLVLDLLAYQLSHALNWNNPLGIEVKSVPNWPTTEAEGYALDERLTTAPKGDMYGKDLAKSFQAFRKKGPEYVRGELVRFLAAQYSGGDEKLSALVAKETKPNIREVWTPTAENFFKRVGGPYLNVLWRDLLDLAEDHPTATSFAKMKKGEKAAKLEALFDSASDTRKAAKLTKEQAAKIDAWVPDCMA